jgi:hypothetical protein
MSEENQEGFVPPFETSEILGDEAKDLIHKRPLLNAENMLKKGKYKSALEIYARIISRFKNPESKEKLKKTILALQEYLSHREPEKVVDDGHKLSPKDPERDFSSALKELTDNLTETLTEGLQQLEKIESELPDDLLPQEPKQEPKPEKEPVPVFIPTQRIDVPLEGIPDKAGIGIDYPKGLVVPPVELPIVPQEPKKENLPKDYQGIQTDGIYKRDDIFSNKRPVYKTLSQPDEPDEDDVSKEKMEIILKKEGDNTPPQINPLPQTDTRQQPEFKLPEGSWIPKEESSFSTSPQTPFPDIPQIELLTHLLNQEDWAPFKHLPLKDRRGGTERRKSIQPVVEERRSNQERRKRDLFQEREEYLKNWSEKVESIRQNYIQSHSENLGGNRPMLELGSTGDFSNIGILGVPDSDISKNLDLIEINLPAPVDSQKPVYSPVDQNNVANYTPLPPPDLRRGVEESRLNVANQEFIRQPGAFPDLIKIDLPNPLTMKYEGFDDAPKRNISWIPADQVPDLTEHGEEKVPEITTDQILYPTKKDLQIKEVFKIDLPNPEDISSGIAAIESPHQGGLPKSVLDEEAPEVELVESDAAPPEDQQLEIPQIEPEPEPERMIHGILELKPPEVDDAPFLTLTYDFSKIPHSFRLSKNYSIMEYSYYKYKSMLMKAQEFARRKMLKNALNYYRVIKAQNIPHELKKMINRNIMDITEFLEKYLMSKGG